MLTEADAVLVTGLEADTVLVTGLEADAVLVTWKPTPSSKAKDVNGAGDEPLLKVLRIGK